MFLREYFELEAGRSSYGLLVRSSFQSPKFEEVAPSKNLNFLSGPDSPLIPELGPEGRVNPANAAAYRKTGLIALVGSVRILPLNRAPRDDFRTIPIIENG